MQLFRNIVENNQRGAEVDRTAREALDEINKIDGHEINELRSYLEEHQHVPTFNERGRQKSSIQRLLEALEIEAAMLWLHI